MFRRSIPVSFFSIAVGLAGFGSSWRVATRVWGVPFFVGEVILSVACVVWLGLVFLYVKKWIFNRNDALAELRHPIQCCFVSLVPVSTLLVALAIAPYSRPLAVALFVLGAAGQLAFAVFRAGGLWRGGREPRDTTPVLYLPVVAGNFAAAMVAGALGQDELGALFFGGGLFSWLALESVILQRLYVQDPLPAALRPLIGIQLAPAAVGCAAYLAITGGTPDRFAEVLFGYACLQALILLRLLPWVSEQGVSASWWAYSFGLAALGLSALRFIELGGHGVVASLAMPVFVIENVGIGALVIFTLRLAVGGRLLPPLAQAAR